MTSLTSDALGEILYWLGEGLVAFNGRYAAHPLLDALLVAEMSKPRHTISVRDAMGPAGKTLENPWFFIDVLATLMNELRRIVRQLLDVAQVSRHMTRLLAPHWRRVHDVVRVVQHFGKGGKGRAPPWALSTRRPSSWYRMAIVKFMAGSLAAHQQRVLHSSFHTMAPTLLGCTTAWETSSRVQHCGLADLKGKWAGSRPTLNDWMNGPVQAREWLKERYAARLAHEAHAKAFAKRLAALGRRKDRGPRDDESDDWLY
jgi:hypothetical protein